MLVVTSGAELIGLKPGNPQIVRAPGRPCVRSAVVGTGTSLPCSLAEAFAKAPVQSKHYLEPPVFVPTTVLVNWLSLAPGCRGTELFGSPKKGQGEALNGHPSVDHVAPRPFL